MKTMRKLSALMLVVIMVFALATTVFAAGDGSITINSATVGETYKLYKIFDATYAGDNVAYTFTKTEANTALYDALVGTDSPFTLTETSDGTYNVGLKNKDELGTDIGVFLKSIEGKMGVAVDSKEATTTTVEFTGLDYGYYYIAKAATPQPGPTVGVTVVTPSQTINDKSTKPGTPDPDPEDPNNPGGYKIFVDKNGSSQNDLTNTANYGDTIYFVLQAKGTNYDDGKKVVEYTAYDVLGEGFKDFSVTKVTVNGNEISNYTYTAGSPATVTIPWVNADGHLYAPTSNIKIYCQAVVDEDAVIGEENSNTTNQGWFNWEYDNGEDGPNNPGEPGFESQTVTTKVYAIALNKTDSKGNPLAGAKFEISKDDVKVPVTEVTAGDNTNAAIYKYDATSTNYTVVSPASGKIIVKGIASGNYTVIETEAPAGYNKMEEAIGIEASEYASSTETLTLYYDSEGNLTSVDKKHTENTVTFDVAAVAKNVINYTGTELPSTGGMGTTLFYTMGGLLVAAAVILLVTKKRMTAET